MIPTSDRRAAAQVIAGFALGLLTGYVFYDGNSRLWEVQGQTWAAWAQAVLSAGAILFSVILWRADKRAEVIAKHEATRVADMRLTMKTAAQLGLTIRSLPEAINNAREARDRGIGYLPVHLKQLLRLDIIYMLEREIGEAPGCSLPISMYALGCATWSKQIRSVLDVLFEPDKSGFVGSEAGGWNAIIEALKMLLKNAKALEEEQDRIGNGLEPG